MGAAAAGVGILAAGGIYSAQQQLQQGKASNEYYQFLASETEIQANKALATGKEEGFYAQEQGAQETKQLKEKQREFAGTQRAAIASTGLAGVTAEELISESVNRERLDEMAIRYNADLKTYESTRNAKVQAEAYRQQASQYRYAGAAALSGAQVGATGTLLSTAGQTFIQSSRISDQKKNTYSSNQRE